MAAVPKPQGFETSMSQSVVATQTAYTQNANARDAAVKDFQGVKENVDNATQDSAMLAGYYGNRQPNSSLAVMSNEVQVPPEEGVVT